MNRRISIPVVVFVCLIGVALLVLGTQSDALGHLFKIPAVYFSVFWVALSIVILLPAIARLFGDRR